MESENKFCVHCADLQSSLVEKEKEIQKLKLHIQNLTKFLLWTNKNVPKSNFSFELHHVDENKNNNKTEISEIDISSRDLVSLSYDILNINSHKMLESKSVQTEFAELENNLKSTPEVDYQGSESNDVNVNDYVYDNNYQMYYSSSTGYYYDEKSGLMYDPQSCAYYKYNYDKQEYEHVSHQPSLSSDQTTSFVSEAVLDQVNNLNLNDKTEESEKVQNVTSAITEDFTDEMKNFDETKEESTGCAKDWQPAEGSELTVSDMVKQVIDEHNSMSDYIYDETYQMYYSSSTGYYYDAARQLLYDPASGIYYSYDADKQKYEFYCQVEPNLSNTEKSCEKEDCVNVQRLKCRKLYWKKKLGKNEQSKESIDILKSNEKEYGEYSEEEEFSSPEDGEIFSSDEDSDPPVCIVRSPVSGSHSSNQKSDALPPSIRAIVEDSEKLKIGSLILITCSGGVIGRDKTNAIYLPDVCISKAHAEIKYNAELQTYCIEDLGSQNGTFINEKRLSETKEKSESCTLNHGDKLSLGSFKVLLHIHEGYETCDNCEPGQVLAEISSNTAQTVVLVTKEEREKQRREELRKLKKKYGLQGAHFEKKAASKIQDYEDKAEIRRQTVGSDNPYEKTQEASINVSMPETNKGYQMLKKLGWKEGQALGATNSGLVEPIPFRPWTSKAGLGSSSPAFGDASKPEERKAKRWVKAQERYFQLSLAESDAS